MWFQRRHRSERKLKTLGEAYFATPDAEGSAAKAYSAEDAPDSASQREESKSPPAPNDVQVRYLPVKQFKSDSLARNPVIEAGPSSGLHFAYNRLRTQIVKRLRQNGWRTVAITSPTRASGATFTAINLAVSMARDFRHSVVLVELDLANPSFREVHGLDHRFGVVDYLLHDAPISEIAFHPGVDRLVVIPAGTSAPNSSELLSSHKMTQFVEELKFRYENAILLFDLPSALAKDDAIAFSPLVDCALIVVEEDETRVNDVRRALDYLHSTEILGIVMNRAKAAEGDGRKSSR